MPRASVDDFLQNFRFHVTMELAAPEDAQVDPIAFDGAVGGVAGFQSVSLPSYSVNSIEYRDGISLHTHKQPGFPSAEDVTLMRGVVRRETKFLDWMFRYFRGHAYRVDMTIHQWDQTRHPEPKSGRWAGERGWQDNQERKTKLYNAFPTNVKPGGDLDATSDEVSVSELTVAYEWFEVLPVSGQTSDDQRIPSQ